MSCWAEAPLKELQARLRLVKLLQVRLFQAVPWNQWKCSQEPSCQVQQCPMQLSQTQLSQMIPKPSRSLLEPKAFQPTLP